MDEVEVNADVDADVDANARALSRMLPSLLHPASCALCPASCVITSEPPANPASVVLRHVGTTIMSRLFNQDHVLHEYVTPYLIFTPRIPTHHAGTKPHS